MRKLPDINSLKSTSTVHPNTSVMGKPTPHESAQLHLTGKALYIDDIAAPEGCLHAYVGIANVACGLLKRQDLTAVAAADAAYPLLVGLVLSVLF